MALADPLVWMYPKPRAFAHNLLLKAEPRATCRLLLRSAAYFVEAFEKIAQAIGL